MLTLKGLLKQILKHASLRAVGQATVAAGATGDAATPQHIHAVGSVEIARIVGVRQSADVGDSP